MSTIDRIRDDWSRLRARAHAGVAAWRARIAATSARTVAGRERVRDLASRLPFGDRARVKHDSTSPNLPRNAHRTFGATIDDDGTTVRVALQAPGLDDASIDVQVRGHELLVRSERHEQRKHHQNGYGVVESSTRRFARAVRLPVEVDADSARATYRDGVVEVTLERTAPAKRIRVETR